MAEEKFHLVSSYAPTGDQPQAIAQLVEGVERVRYSLKMQNWIGLFQKIGTNTKYLNEVK